MFAELLLYTPRHVQHHAGQVNLLLRQNGAPGRGMSSGRRGSWDPTDLQSAAMIFRRMIDNW